METRAITFEEIQDICALATFISSMQENRCSHDDIASKKLPCTSANCPVWRKLKKLATTDRNTQE
jgi:hypothetical protein